jgi:hypothetical protein
MEEIPFPLFYIKVNNISLEQHLSLFFVEMSVKIYFSLLKNKVKNPIERLNDRYFKTIRYPSCIIICFLYIEKYLYLLLIS